MERIQKFLSECGVASRRKSEELVLLGKVKVNGVVVKELGTKVSNEDTITVNDKLVQKEDKEYYLLYKPEKVVTTTKDEKARMSVVDLIDTKSKIYPIGRLDYDTSGILLLTNDGELANLLMHPSHDIEKVYNVKIDGLIKGPEIKELENGIIIDGNKTKKAKVKLKKTDLRNRKSYLEVTITEGRNHEVKNMFSHFGYKVLKLKRIRYAYLVLGDLKMGEYRKLSYKEIKDLYTYAKAK